MELKMTKYTLIDVGPGPETFYASNDREFLAEFRRIWWLPDDDDVALGSMATRLTDFRGKPIARSSVSDFIATAKAAGLLEVEDDV